MTRIDFNCDLGEGSGHDVDLMPLITSANIACGAHAGDRESMIATVELARRHAVGIGAHPGYADATHFGRLEQAVSPGEAASLVTEQVARLAEIAGEALRHVKLHGALYNQVAREPGLAHAVAAELSARWPRLIVFALAGSVFARVARERGLRVAEEVFADRRYRADGTLTPRGEPGAVITDEAASAAQVLDLVRDGRVRAGSGTMVPIRADTLCLHGDGPDPVTVARRLRRELASVGIEVRTFGAPG